MSGYRFILSIGLLFLVLTACNNQKKDVPTEEEKVQAIKDVLKHSVDDAVTFLSKENGFLLNDSLPITFPAETQSMIDNIKKLPQGNEMLTKVMSLVNQAAASSVEAITPVLYAAIDDLTIEDVNRILLADSAAATAYLEKRARIPIQKACEPIIFESLDKQIWGDITTRDTWNGLVDNYNKLAGTSLGKIAKLEAVNIELEEIVSEKVLDAVFYLMAKEEMRIRKHPATRISKSMAKSLGWGNQSE